MDQISPLKLFDAFGIELEYMIVDRQTLNVVPISHHLLLNEDDYPVSEVEHGPIAWSNELTQHVIELKTNGPRSQLSGLATEFLSQIHRINERLFEDDAQLLPTAMHPWMNPEQELQLWPYDFSPVYQAFHRVFDCRGHGWANLQSMHLNLPFHGDEEFCQLHAAVRLLLPLLPGLAASSPWIEGRFAGALDQRLHVYANNSRRIPAVTGRVIPEPVYSEQDYRAEILDPMYREIAPDDPQGVLQEEFLNARGAIARFERGAIEIRVIDVQECPQADVAIAALVIAVLKQLVAADPEARLQQQGLTVEELREIFDAAVLYADASLVTHRPLLQLLGISANEISLKELWQTLFLQVETELSRDVPELLPILKQLLQRGCLAREMVRCLGTEPTHSQLHHLYQELGDCLTHGELWTLQRGGR